MSKVELRFEVNITASDKLALDTPTQIAWLIQLLLSKQDMFKVDSVVPVDYKVS